MLMPVHAIWFLHDIIELCKMCCFFLKDMYIQISNRQLSLNCTNAGLKSKLKCPSWVISIKLSHNPSC